MTILPFRARTPILKFYATVNFTPFATIHCLSPTTPLWQRLPLPGLFNAEIRSYILKKITINIFLGWMRVWCVSVTLVQSVERRLNAMLYESMNILPAPNPEARIALRIYTILYTNEARLQNFTFIHLSRIAVGVLPHPFTNADTLLDIPDIFW